MLETLEVRAGAKRKKKGESIGTSWHKIRVPPVGLLDLRFPMLPRTDFIATGYVEIEGPADVFLLARHLLFGAPSDYEPRSQ
jgi:hypothetical protein